VALVLPAGGSAATPTIALVATTPLAFSPNGDGRADLLGLRVTLATAGRLDVAVRTFEGETAVTLHNGIAPAGATTITWDGTAGGTRSPEAATGGTARDMPIVAAYGTFPDGPYTVVATANGASASLRIAIWRTQPVVADPGRIVVTLDPGHGGTDTGTSGRTPDGVKHLEKDANLDVGLKAGAMLKAAGYVVRYTRTTDVNRSLPQRTAYANAGRSDVLIGMHFNQISGARGRTEVYYCGRGCYGALSSRSLAQSVLDAHRARLAQYENDSFHLSPSPDHGWAAIDDYNRWFGNSDCTGIIACHFGLLGPYSPTLRPNAATMPAILMESLAFSNPGELALIVDPDARTQIAAAYADGIGNYFASRTPWVRQDLAAPLPRLRRGGASSVKIRVSNTGAAAIPAGSSIVVGDRSRTSANDPGTVKGTTIGSVALTKALAPGESVTVSVRVVPTVRGKRTWKVDLVVAGVRLSERRLPQLLVHAVVH
jgi:N-acetylmuramoyl-L-alanine amidase